MTLILQNVSKNPKESQIEFVHYTLELVNILMLNSELRQAVLDAKLSGIREIEAQPA